MKVPLTKISGININYKIEGEGQPLVMIAGIGLDLGMWNPQVPAFKKAFRLIRFDNKGAGKSDKPKGPYSIRDMAAETMGLLDNLGIDQASFLGLSLGGFIAQEIAINYPHRVTKLVLSNTLACWDNDSGLSTEAMKLLEKRSAGLARMKFLTAWFRLTLRSPFRRLTSFLTTMLKSNKASQDGYQAQMEAAAKHNTFDRLHLIKAPTLVIVGTDDRLIRPSSSDVLATKIPHAKLVKIANGSHRLLRSV